MMPLLELSDVSGHRKSKAVATKPEILISQLLFGHSAFESLDMGVAFGICCYREYKLIYT